MPNVSDKPKSLRIRTYQVGFGDCFLLTFHYPKEDRHVLIDFGTTGTPDSNDKDVLTATAQDIKKAAGGKLHAVVLTHRHRDHIRGFSTESRDGDAGSVIRALKPDLIVQPWTEDPNAPINATGPMAAAAKTRKSFSAVPHYLAALQTMHAVAAQVAKSSNTFLLTPQHEELSFLGEDNLQNASAVKNLQAMGKAARYGSEYVYYGSPTKLDSTVLPGVSVKVLGPPTANQHKQVKTEKSKSPEFWMLYQQFWMDQARTWLTSSDALGDGGFRVAADGANVPIWARWFVRRARQANASEALSLVRILDEAMNNTSVILLFTIGSKTFLFPGDAQIENWEYALKFAPDKQKNLDAFRTLTLYKVGHHGSRNATPKTLFHEMAEQREQGTGQLSSVMSTMPGKHGKAENKSEVPRATLVKALRKAGKLESTSDLAKAERFFDEIYQL